MKYSRHGMAWYGNKKIRIRQENNIKMMPKLFNRLLARVNDIVATCFHNHKIHFMDSGLEMDLYVNSFDIPN